MEKSVILLLCSFYVLSVRCEVTLEADRPSVKVEVNQRALLECCFTSNRMENLLWIKSIKKDKSIETFFVQNPGTERWSEKSGQVECGFLSLKEAKLGDTGFYQCFLNSSEVFSHGTYLQVYERLEKTIKLSESVKNGILVAEGVLLLLCVVLPSASLLFKSKSLKDMQRKKARLEEENIYQGLNLDDCCETYDQIERLQGDGPYEDVGSNEEDFQLEKP